MRVLAIFVTALFAALYVRQKGVVKGEGRIVPSGEVWEPTTKDFEQVIAEAWVVTQEKAKDVFTVAEDAVSNIVNEVGAVVVQTFGTKYDDIIRASALANGIDPSILYKLLYAESHFRDDIITGKVRSSTGALGIAQFMPATAVEELGSVDAALNPSIAIPGAARYLAKLIRSTGSVDAGVAAYNWGIGNVKRKGLAKAPQETVNYVSAITGTNLKG